jgi:hypothetical protein
VNVRKDARGDQSATGSSLADELAGLHLYHQLAVVPKVIALYSFCLFFSHVDSSDGSRYQNAAGVLLGSVFTI